MFNEKHSLKPQPYVRLGFREQQTLFEYRLATSASHLTRVSVSCSATANDSPDAWDPGASQGDI